MCVCAAFSVVLEEFSAPPEMWFCGQTGHNAPCGVQGLCSSLNVCSCIFISVVMDLAEPAVYLLLFVCMS